MFYSKLQNRDNERLKLLCENGDLQFAVILGRYV